ncbi:MAG: formate--tetrahydrofolate ligase [Candidatus Thermoplasmatota archaeon]|nr:formate--tetrahydrofolate ligase [Candidatus Thermoplasmatota archaeon]
MLSDIEIAQAAKLRPIEEIARKAGLAEDEYTTWGSFKAKIELSSMERITKREPGHLILVTTTSPTPAGEGKTTMTIGLAQALSKLGHSSMLGIREPSMGPVFGIKGGAAGGGYSQVLPMEDINLHFTGDMHAVTAAHNLMSAVLNNHMHHGNELDIDPRRITWHRVMDMNDRSLRHAVIGLGGTKSGMPQEDSFDITAASEIMAIVCLATSLEDLKEKISRIIVAYNMNKEPIYAKDLGVVGAMAMLLKDALRPNLVQTIEGVPAFIHGGPFANIAHGTSSYLSTKIGLHLSKYFITEAGFGSDLGAEKFFDIFCRKTGLAPSAVVMVVTTRSLKMQGGAPRNELEKRGVLAVKKGMANLSRHLHIIQLFGLPVVVAINKFESDHEDEIQEIKRRCDGMSIPTAVSDHHARGGNGAIEVARKLVEVVENCKSCFNTLYPDDLPLKEKIKYICNNVYGANKVQFSVDAQRKLDKYEKLGFGELPICMAKTQYSLSDDPKLLGAPKKFKITISDVRLSAGAGFVVPLTGRIMTMPGLPKVPAAEKMDVTEDGKAIGLF